MSPATIAASVVDGDPVRRWRLEQLIRSGYREWDALVLSGRSDVDLHRAVDLLRAGCSSDLATRILI